jgi:DNA-directed RNA polymerase specialized sigma24 family protein
MPGSGQNGSEALRPSWRHPAGVTRVFDPALAETLIRQFNASQGADIAALNALLKHVEPLAKSILEYRASTKHEDIDELLSRVRLKLWKSLRLFDPLKGSSFTFCSRVILSAAMSSVGEAWQRNERYCELAEAAGSTAPADIASREVVKDIEYKVRRARSACTNPSNAGRKGGLSKALSMPGSHLSGTRQVMRL